MISTTILGNVVENQVWKTGTPHPENTKMGSPTHKIARDSAAMAQQAGTVPANSNHHEFMVSFS